MQTDDKNKLAIPPFEIEGEVKSIATSDIIPGHKTLFNYPEALVVYVDVMGFSHKIDGKDIESTLIDFAAPLALASLNFPSVRFNVFSDCAFLAASLQNAKAVVSSVRFAFREWISDGILVRGGMAIGEYSETSTIAIQATKGNSNFTGNIFAGSGIVNSVRLEGNGKGAFLFMDKKTASYLYSTFGEGCFRIEDQMFSSWSDDDKILSVFLGTSLWRLTKLYCLNQANNNPVAMILINNICYALDATDSPLPYCFMLAILKSKFVLPKVKKQIYDYFKIDIKKDEVIFRKLITAIRSHTDFLVVKGVADLDSSIH